MAHVKLEVRLARLEAEVAELKRERVGTVVSNKPWWEQISGVFKDSPEFEEAARLGREWRESQQMDYSNEGATVTDDTHGSA